MGDVVEKKEMEKKPNDEDKKDDEAPPADNANMQTAAED